MIKFSVKKTRYKNMYKILTVHPQRCFAKWFHTMEHNTAPKKNGEELQVLTYKDLQDMLLGELIKVQ